MSKTRRGFMKTGLGCIGGFISIATVKAETFQTIRAKKGGKIEISYLSILCGNEKPLTVQRHVATQAMTMVMEAPFIIYWEGRKHDRRDDGRDHPRGSVVIDLIDIGNETHLIKNLDTNKLTDWIISHLTAIPDRKRIQKFVVGEMAWEARISLDTIKLLQKNG